MQNKHNLFHISFIYFQIFKFVRVCSLVVRYFYNKCVYSKKKFKIRFSFNIKDDNIFPCLQNIRLFYTI